MITDTEIEAFIREFEKCTLPRSEWTHQRHLLMALWYVWQHGQQAATPLIREGIQRYNHRQGNHTGYHETITLAWISVIDRFLSARNRGTPISALACELLDECGDKHYLLRFYSRERLLSEEARARWLGPDLAEIGQSAAARTEGNGHGQGQHQGEAGALR
jgi:hypothetical protein